MKRASWFFTLGLALVAKTTLATEVDQPVASAVLMTTVTEVTAEHAAPAANDDEPQVDAS